jgi:hypothetical protein
MTENPRRKIRRLENQMNYIGIELEEILRNEGMNVDEDI